MLRITLVKSFIGFPERTRRTVRGLGLNKIGSSAVHSENACVLGMIRKINHLLQVEKLQDETEAK